MSCRKVLALMSIVFSRGESRFYGIMSSEILEIYGEDASLLKQFTPHSGCLWLVLKTFIKSVFLAVPEVTSLAVNLNQKAPTRSQAIRNILCS